MTGPATHHLTVTGRRFRRLPWPKTTLTYSRVCSCAAAEEIAKTFRSIGAVVSVQHEALL